MNETYQDHFNCNSQLHVIKYDYIIIDPRHRSTEPIFDGKFLSICSFSSIESRCEQVFPFKQCHGFVIVFAGRYIDENVCLVFAETVFSRTFSLKSFFPCTAEEYLIDLVSFLICSG